MKIDMFPQTLLNKVHCACRAMDRPVIRKRIDAELGIFADRSASKPVVGIDIDGEWCYKLSCALKILAIAMLAMWIMCRISHVMRKWF